MKLGSWLVEKLNPAQRYIALEYPEASSREPDRSYIYYYENLEIVNRAVNMLVDDTAEINFSITPEKVGFPIRGGVKRKTIETLLNYQPNPYQDIHSFRRALLRKYLCRKI